MTAYRIVKYNRIWKPYMIQVSENKKKYEDYQGAMTENGIRKKWFNLFNSVYNKQIKEVE